MSIYLLVNILVLLIPLLFSFDSRVSFYKDWPGLWPALLLTGTLFIIWDALFTHFGIWGFNKEYLMGWNLLGLPFEEWLFFLTIPYACLFSYRVLNVWIPLKGNPKVQRQISFGLILIFAVFALLFRDRIYSLITFSLAALFILITEWLMKAPFLLSFYRAYLIILIPFIIVNGLLTGTGLEQPVVWYNHAENMNLRLFTIPLEDGVYGFLLIGLNIVLLEYFIKKRRKTLPFNKKTPLPTTP